MTLRKRMRQEYNRGHRHAIEIGSPDPSVSEKPPTPYERWAYTAGFQDGRAEVGRKARVIDSYRATLKDDV